MNCSECRPLLCDLIHEALDSKRAASVQMHLDACEACRAEAGALRETVALLEQLEPVEDPSDVSALLDAATARDQVPAPPRFRGALIGAAAAILLFLGLLAVSAEVRYESGRLVIAFGRGAMVEPAVDFADYEPYVQRAAREEFTLQRGGIVETFLDALDEINAAQAGREEMLLRALEAQRREDMQAIEAQLRLLAEEAMQRDLALGRLASLASRIEPVP